jgi:carboxymethylenebutenolidase
MSEWLQLNTRDGKEISAYLARPEGEIKGGLVVVQEIFGVNQHIQSVVDGYAKQGYLTIAPALFDRIEPGVKLAYSGEDMQKAFALYGKLDPEAAILDVAAAFQQVQGEGAGAGVVGFCYGGLMAWLSATRGKANGFEPKCTVGYYPGGVGKVANETPNCPVMLHFGAEDTHIGKDQIDAVRDAHPEVQIFVYSGAAHAFNRDLDPNSYHPEAAELARQRTLDFLAKNIR